MKFKNLKIQNWKQIDYIDIDFHPKLTVLTGANGSGKTTILNILARHVGWEVPELSVPVKDKKTGIIQFVNNAYRIAGSFAKIISDGKNIVEQVKDTISKELKKDTKIGELSLYLFLIPWK